VKLLHILLLVYWLGADVGTYYASRFVADARLSSAARATAAKIMLGVDLLPRVAMPLMLASGVHLAAAMGALAWAWPALVWQAGAWLLCGAWLAMVLAIHHHSAGPGWLVRVDFWFRVALAAGLVLAVAGALLWQRPPLLPWLAIKLLAFAATVACGLMIRVKLRPFGPAFAQIMRGGSEAVMTVANTTLAASIAGCKPFVWAIWALLVLASAAGLHYLP